LTTMPGARSGQPVRTVPQRGIVARNFAPHAFTCRKWLVTKSSRPIPVVCICAVCSHRSIKRLSGHSGAVLWSRLTVPKRRACPSGVALCPHSLSSLGLCEPTADLRLSRSPGCLAPLAMPRAGCLSILKVWSCVGSHKSKHICEGAWLLFDLPHWTR